MQQSDLFPDKNVGIPRLAEWARDEVAERTKIKTCMVLRMHRSRVRPNYNVQQSRKQHHACAVVKDIHIIGL